MRPPNNQRTSWLSSLALALCLTVSQIKYTQSFKIDCHPLGGSTQENCEALGCVWEPAHLSSYSDKSSRQDLPFDWNSLSLIDAPVESIHKGVQVDQPWCFFPDQYVGYKVSQLEGSNRFRLERQRSSGIPNDIAQLNLDIDSHASQAGGSILRVRIYDSQQKRYEPQLPQLNLDESSEEQNGEFNVQVNERDELIVSRKSNGAILFNTDLNKLIFADQFIQLNTRLNTSFVYGLGEHYGSFLKEAKDSYKTYSFYHTDRLPLPGGTRSYSGFPFYVNLDSWTEKAHGVYLRNSNGMDVILQPDQSITFRPIGGILDFFIFSGPTANDVTRQFQHLVGLPDLPPRWALGFHLCRYNYHTLEKTHLVWNRTRSAGIPFDSQWNDIDYMDRHNDFTYDKGAFDGLPEFVEKLHALDMHYMILFDPGVSAEDNYYPYSLGATMDIFVKNATNQTLIGKVWNDSGRTVFPDFSNPKSIEYWSELFTKMQAELKYDGAWIDMNDISSFVEGSLDGCPNVGVENPVYQPGGYRLQEHSLCLSAKHQAGLEYDVHNLYSFYEAVATFKALQAARPGKRPFIISRSTSPGQGHFGGHWSGDVLSTWDYLKWSIPSLIEHSMYGFSMMGSDICGFNGNTTSELCARWSTLGAFYTFTRNHNDDTAIDQDPVALGQDVVDANKFALTKKYSLLPYIYTLIHRAHRFGEPSIRSVPLEFHTTDREALKVEHQFMWGTGLMISPVVDQNTFTKSTYLPEGRWYETNVVFSDTYKPTKLIKSNGEWFTTDNIAITDIPLFFRGGSIIPYYKTVGATTVETANQPISLQVARCHKNRAHGELYLDEGDNVDNKYNHLTMHYEKNKLVVTQDKDEYASYVQIAQVKFLGLDTTNLSLIKVNGRNSSAYEKYDHEVVLDLGTKTIVANHKSLEVELFF